MRCNFPKAMRRASWLPGAVVGAIPAAMALVGVLSVGWVACGPSEDGTAEGAAPSGAEGGEGPEAGSDAASTEAPEAGSWLEGMSVGRAVDPQGAVPTESVAAVFASGDVIYVSIGVGEAPADAAVHVAFYDPSGERVAEDEKKVPAEARYLYFDSGDTRHWEPGRYRVEVSVDGEVVHERELTLGGTGAPSPAPE